ncbi:MAG: nitronate monooxygenase [Patescibacteria group bacterium]|jgi:NAD(P)H-dependent flavin oxidoreductase YrpB (nitropropane dioxygenase family)
MEYRPLRIGQYEFPVPIVQGGMGVKISGPSLVGPVAEEGAGGTMTAIGLGKRTHRMSFEDFNRTSCEALRHEIESLRMLTSKPFAVNIMGALSNPDDLIRTAVNPGNDSTGVKIAGANIIVFGAGIPKTLPAIVDDPTVALVPIVSSARLAEFIIKLWLERYGRLPDAVVIEGPLAGGHLGFSLEQLLPENIGKFSLENILRETLQIINRYEQEYGRKIPIIVAGGVYTGEDIAYYLSLGASAAQLGTRFVATFECPVSERFKLEYVQAKPEDIRIIRTPVGMPGRVLNNKFLKELAKLRENQRKGGETRKLSCPYHCLRSCEQEKALFCIAEQLDQSFDGEIDNGLIFCGANVYRIDRIMSVHELITELMDGVKASALTLPSTL